MTASRQRPQSSRIQCRQVTEVPDKRPGSAPKGKGLPTRFKASEHAAATPWQAHWRAAYPKQLVEPPRIPVNALIVETELYRAGIMQSGQARHAHNSSHVDQIHSEIKDQLSKQGLLTWSNANRITPELHAEPKLKKSTNATSTMARTPSFDYRCPASEFSSQDAHVMTSSPPPGDKPSFFKRASLLATNGVPLIHEHEDENSSRSLPVSPRRASASSLPRASLSLAHGTKQPARMSLSGHSSFAMYLQRNKAPMQIDEQDNQAAVPGSLENMEKRLQNVGEDFAEAALIKREMMEKQKNEALNHHGSFEHCVMLSRKHMVDISEIRRCLADFRRIDADGDNCVQLEEFEEYIRQLGSFPEGTELPSHIAESFLKLDSDGNGNVDFEEFVAWSLEAKWMEDLVVANAEDLKNRALARKYEMSLIAVENYRCKFKAYDTDGSGEINEQEFVEIVIKLLNIKNRDHAPTKRIERCWNEVDTDHSGTVCFEEFLAWMKRGEKTGNYLST